MSCDESSVAGASWRKEGLRKLGGYPTPDWSHVARLPDRAEDELIRIRYMSLRERGGGTENQHENRVSVGHGRSVGQGKVKKRILPSVREGGMRKRRKSNEDVWFTTLAELELSSSMASGGLAEKEEGEPVWREGEEGFFLDVLREVDDESEEGRPG